MTNTIAASSASKIAQFKGHKNSVGFMPIQTCPFATESCTKVCYVEKTFRYPAVKKVLSKNTEGLFFLDCTVLSPHRLTSQLRGLVWNSLRQRERRLAKLDKFSKEYKRLKQRGHIFRWQWSGDVVSANHAKAIYTVSQEFPATSFWLYTRSFPYVKHLVGLDNLHVYLSVDRDNHIQAILTHQNYPTTKLAWMGEGPAEAVTCPATNGRLKGAGACNTCGICYNTSKHVLFNIH